MPVILKNIIFALIPKKRISAHVIGVIIGAVAAFLGMSQTDLKNEVCKDAPVVIEAPVAK